MPSVIFVAVNSRVISSFEICLTKGTSGRSYTKLPTRGRAKAKVRRNSVSALRSFGFHVRSKETGVLTQKTDFLEVRVTVRRQMLYNISRPSSQQVKRETFIAS